MRLQPQQPFLVPRLNQFVHQLRGSGEADAQAPLACGQPQGQGNVRFADAGGPQQDHVLAPADVLAAGKVEDQHLVQAGNSLEVKAFQLFDGGKAGLLDAAFDQPALPVDQFQFGEPGQIGDVIDAFIGTEPGLLGVLAQEGR